MPCSLPSHCRTHRSRGSDRRQTLAPGRGHPLLSHSLVTCGCNSSEFKSVFQHWVFSAVSACSHPPCSVLGGLGLTAARGSTSDLPSAQVKPGRVGSSVSVSRPPPLRPPMEQKASRIRWLRNSALSHLPPGRPPINLPVCLPTCYLPSTYPSPLYFSTISSLFIFLPFICFHGFYLWKVSLQNNKYYSRILNFNICNF